MVHGPDAGVELLTTLEADERVAGHHRLQAMRGHLLEMARLADLLVRLKVARWRRPRTGQRFRSRAV